MHCEGQRIGLKTRGRPGVVAVQSAGIDSQLRMGDGGTLFVYSITGGWTTKTKPFKQTTIVGASEIHQSDSNQEVKRDPRSWKPAPFPVQMSKCVEANIIGFVIEQKFPYIESVTTLLLPAFPYTAHFHLGNACWSDNSKSAVWVRTAFISPRTLAILSILYFFVGFISFFTRTSKIYIYGIVSYALEWFSHCELSVKCRDGRSFPARTFFPRVVFPVSKNPPILPKKNSSIRHHGILVSSVQ